MPQAKEILTIRDQVEHWLKTFVTQPHFLLGNWPPCPYAQRAWMSGRVEVLPFQGDGALFLSRGVECLESQARDVVIGVCESWQDWPVPEWEQWVAAARRQLESFDLILMSDHPQRPEIVAGVKMNHGHLLLIFLQKKSALKSASAELVSQGYYAQWEPHLRDKMLKMRET